MKRHIGKIKQHIHSHAQRIVTNKHVKRMAFIFLGLLAVFTIGFALLTAFKWQHGYISGVVTNISSEKIELVNRDGDILHILVPESWDKEHYRLSSGKDEVRLGSKVVVLGKFLPDGCLVPMVIRVVN